MPILKKWAYQYSDACQFKYAHLQYAHYFEYLENMSICNTARISRNCENMPSNEKILGFLSCFLIVEVLF